MRISLILFAMLLSAISGCQRSGNSNRNVSPVFFVVKDISDKYQSSPVSPYSTSYEVEVTVVVGCRSKQGLRFDQIQSVFYTGSTPQCGVTHVLEGDDSIIAYYSQSGQTDAPNISSQLVFELKYGEGMPVVLTTANSNYGLFAPGTDRKVVITLLLQEQTIYGPFDISLPWPNQD